MTMPEQTWVIHGDPIFGFGPSDNRPTFGRVGGPRSLCGLLRAMTRTADPSTRITIAPYWHTATVCRELRPDAAIVVLGPADRLPPHQLPGIPEESALRLWFDDVSVDTRRGGTRVTQLKAPTASDIEALVAFVRQVGRGASYLVSCRAGTSRSVSLSILLATIAGASTAELRSLRFGRNYYKPSLVLLGFAHQVVPERAAELLALAREKEPPWTKADDWSAVTYTVG